jgi:hypothetical protein
MRPRLWLSADPAAKRTGLSRGSPLGLSENRSGGEAGAEARSVSLTARGLTDPTIEIASRRSRLAYMPLSYFREASVFAPASPKVGRVGDALATSTFPGAGGFGQGGAGL